MTSPRDQVADIMKRIYDSGMTTLSGGNLSLKDEDGSIWITPAGTDKGRMQPADVVCVRADGTVEGQHSPSSELPFHRGIYERRPDLGGIAHAHAPALVAFSIVRRIPHTDVLPQVYRLCGPVGYAPYALTGSERLGETIAATFAEGYDVVLLENHGAVAAGPDLLRAFQRLEAWEFCARASLRAQTLGSVHRLDEGERALFEATAPRDAGFQAAGPEPADEGEEGLRQQVAAMARRACERGLMASADGAISVRVDEEGFLITPEGGDRWSLAVGDVVLVGRDRHERGKVPGRETALHAAVYHRQPQVNAVITARPPEATAYSLAGAAFDSRTIPESYVMLREVPLVPYADQFEAVDDVAGRVSAETPVLLLENGGALTSGRSLVKAFDRLEVLEFSARSLLDSAAVGPLKPIGDADMETLKEAFPVVKG